MIVIMRLIHIVLGTFWTGTLIFTAVFLLPAVRDAGPDGAKVAGALIARRFLEVMPAAALLTIGSGLWLYWRLTNGFQPEAMHSPMGATIGFGAAASLVAFTLGVTIMRPSTLKAAALVQRAAQSSGPERDTQLAMAQALRARAAGAGRLVALLLTLAAAAMAVARYI